MLDRKREIDTFKENINLCEYACEKYGFAIRQNESSRAYKVLKKPDSDKLVVSKSPQNHWVYFNVFDRTDSGTIVDLIQNRENLNLGQIRKELRSWSNTSTVSRAKYADITYKPVDLDAVRNQFNSFQPATNTDYLESRYIDPSVIQSKRFYNKLKQNNLGHLIAPHRSHDGLVGFEIIGSGAKRYSDNSERSIWSSACLKDDQYVIFTESVIDTLSLFQMRDEDNSRYHCTSGAIGGRQLGTIVSILKKAHADNRVVVAAFDNDDAGTTYTESLRELCSREQAFETITPKPFKDWNDQLKDKIS